MLFRSMQTYLPHLNGKVFPKTNMYINSLNVRKNLIYKRFLYSNSFESGAIKLIKKILLDMDIENMVLKRKTDVSRYFDVMLSDKDQLESIFDMNETNTIRINSFVSSDKGRCNEYIIPIESTDPLQTLPFEQGWDMWRHIRPVRIMDIKSNELTFNTYLDKIIFKEQCPSHIVIGIDVVALGLQFVNYLKSFNLQKTDDNVSNYIHRYVLCFMLDDLMSK